jgi:hypothetical protein
MWVRAKGQTDKIGVQQDVCAARFDGAKADAVGDLVGLAGQDHLVQRQPLRRPERDLRERSVAGAADHRS